MQRRRGPGGADPELCILTQALRDKRWMIEPEVPVPGNPVARGIGPGRARRGVREVIAQGRQVVAQAELLGLHRLLVDIRGIIASADMDGCIAELRADPIDRPRAGRVSPCAARSTSAAWAASA